MGFVGAVSSRARLALGDGIAPFGVGAGGRLLEVRVHVLAALCASCARNCHERAARVNDDRKLLARRSNMDSRVVVTQGHGVAIKLTFLNGLI